MVTSGEGATGMHATKHPTMRRTALHNQSFPVQSVSSAEFEEPCRRALVNGGPILEIRACMSFSKLAALVLHLYFFGLQGNPAWQQLAGPSRS